MRDHLNRSTILRSVAVLAAVLALSSVSHAQTGQQAAPTQGQRRTAPRLQPSTCPLIRTIFLGSGGLAERSARTTLPR